MGEKPLKPLFNVHDSYRQVIIINPYRFGGLSGDPDAIAYFTALGISSPLTLTDGSTLTAQQVFDAINTYFLAEKASGAYSKFIIIRPNIGSTLARCKLNAVNPLDTDLAFRATYENNPPFGAWGVTFGGVGTGQIERDKLFINGLTNNNFTISHYQNNEISENGAAFGTYKGTGTVNGIYLDPKYAGTTCYYNAGGATERSFASTSSKGHFIMTSYNNGSNDKTRVTINTTVKADVNDTKTTLPNLEFIWGGVNSAETGVAPYGARTGYSAIANQALTTAQELAHYNAVTALMTTLKRNN